MNTLTCAELLLYPGKTFTERVEAHHAEIRNAVAPPRAAPCEVVPPSVRRAGRLHGALPFGAVVDLTRFTGRDRLERAANYLRAHVPRTSVWAEDELRAVAGRVLAGAQRVIE